jgi:uncharacterized protein (UPF0276 family)
MTVARPALGISFEGRPSTLLEDLAPLVDVVEVVPETLVANYSDAADERVFAVLDEYASDLDVVYHGSGLSIGTATRWNDEYLRLLERLCEHRSPRWHSEHLGFAIVEGHFLGTVAAVPATMEAADLVTARADAIRKRFGTEFLLEHVASPFARPDEMTTAAFMNIVARGSGCGLILDLHNLECDEDDGRLTADAFLAELDLALVREIHVAGGTRRDGFHLDEHSQLPSAGMLGRLEQIVPQCPSVELVVFEMDGGALATVDRDALFGALRDLRHRIEVSRVAG